MKSNKANIIVIVVCFTLAVCLCLFLALKGNKKLMTDGERFKEQYEAVNKLESEYTYKKYVQLTIDKDNPFIYKTAKETLDILKNEKAIVFMGYPESDLTRTILPILLDSFKDNNIKEVYYLDILEIRDEFVFSGSIMPTEVRKGTNAYYELVDFLKDYLDEYYVEDEVGNRYDTLVKRINTPTIITVKNGEVLDYHSGAVIYHNEEHFELNEAEQVKLKEIFDDIMKKYNDEANTCSSSDKC